MLSMFFIGFFSNIIPFILLGLGSISMLYYSNQEKIDEKLSQLLNQDNIIVHEVGEPNFLEILLTDSDNNGSAIVNYSNLISDFSFYPDRQNWSPDHQKKYLSQNKTSTGLRGPPSI